MAEDRGNLEAGPAAGSVVTVVLRLLSRPLERGELVGHGVVVATGAAAEIRNGDDLVRLANGDVTVTEGTSR